MIIEENYSMKTKCLSLYKRYILYVTVDRIIVISLYVGNIVLDLKVSNLFTLLQIPRTFLGNL